MPNNKETKFLPLFLSSPFLSSPFVGPTVPLDRFWSFRGPLACVDDDLQNPHSIVCIDNAPR